jgi:6,7-dimethyl-8-ribityllumazine synthase
MTKVIEGLISAAGLKAAVAVSRFNGFVTERLLDGAVDAFLRHGGDEADLTVVRVPGAFELPLAVQALARSGRFGAVVALGAIIRGQTPHFDFVAAEATKGVALAALESGLAVSFGVLTCDTVEQAVDRAGAKAGNKGFDAMVSAMEMASVLRLIDGA